MKVLPSSIAFPSVTDFLLYTPLYQSFEISEENVDKAIRIEKFIGPLDAFCVSCKQDSVFRLPGVSYSSRYIEAPNINSGSTPPPSKIDKYISERVFEVELNCSRDDNHTIYFYFRVVDKTIAKIGQFPSIADFHVRGIDRYRSILDKQRYKEFARAIGLASHGVGVGSFEALIEEEHKQAATDTSWDEAKYIQSRMDEKILLLRSRLPPFLVENKSLYSILSKGIHTLEEEETLQYFDIVRSGIELILDEHIEQRVKEKKIEETQKAINILKKNLSS
jgi:hypothetical protein